jgi:hypothetical protein
MRFRTAVSLSWIAVSASRLHLSHASHTTHPVHVEQEFTHDLDNSSHDYITFVARSFYVKHLVTNLLMTLITFIWPILHQVTCSPTA